MDDAETQPQTEEPKRYGPWEANRPWRLAQLTFVG